MRRDPVAAVGRPSRPGDSGRPYGRMLLVMATAVGSVLATGVPPATAVPAAAVGATDPDSASGEVPTGADPVPPALAGALRRAMLTGSDPGGGGEFGIQVAISGDSAIVGAPGELDPDFNQGVAYVFIRTGTTWTQQARLTSLNARTGLFGKTVAISGNTAVVGVGDEHGGSSRESITVFVRSGTTWSEQGTMSGQDDRGFGESVAISGDTIVVGEAFSNGGPGKRVAGAAYVFVRSGTTWTLRAKLTASDAADGDGFGSSVDFIGDTVVIGAALDDTGAGSGAGSAYVFVRAGTTWTEQAKLTASDGAGMDQFGSAVAVSGNTVVVAAVNLNRAGFQGAAYVFARSGTVWTQQAKLTASDAADGDFFGRSVDVSGVTVLVGAPGEPLYSLNPGSAYVFVRSGTAWTEVSQLGPVANQRLDNFGYSVALDIRSAALVGAPFDDTAGGIDAGSVWAYSLSS